MNQTLRELEIINRLLGGNSATINGISKLVGNLTDKERTITIADIGCGGGDMLKEINRWAKQNDIKVELTGIDANPSIVNFARENCVKYSNIYFRVLNIFDPEFQNKSFDIITATLFTHHFGDKELSQLLAKLCRQAKVGIVINDLHRHWLAFYSIRILTWLFSRSEMVKFDAPISVLRAFKKNEIISILSQAGIERYLLGWKWAFRWQLVIPTSLA